MDKAEEKQLADLLSKLEPGFLPYEIFVQIARLVVLSIIEFVPLRTNNGVVEVLLLEREPDDDIWPGEVHTPGTVVRPTDSSGDIYKAFERIRQDELKGIKISNGHFVGTQLHSSRRGMEHAQIFWVEVYEDPIVGTFYPVNELPPNMMESQIDFIKLAVNSYQSERRN